jgi:hypothetical protein
MGRRIIASFEREHDLLMATRQARLQGWQIVDAYTPYAVHGLDRAMGLRPSRLPWACFGFGVLGVASAFLFQFWTMAINWPINVGGKPWNSLPAYVPVAFEMMVLLAGLGVVASFLLRCRLFPGKKGTPSVPGATDDRFVLVVENPAEAPASDGARALFQDFHDVRVEACEV